MAILMRKEFSAGGVVYKKAVNSTQVLLIARDNKKIWCLPKGKIEKNETPEEAAIREIKEETGASGKIIRLLGDIYYQFISPVDKARVFKNVRFFLFEYTGGAISGQDSEVEEAGWFDTEEALKIMAYPSEKKIVRKAAIKNEPRTFKIFIFIF